VQLVIVKSGGHKHHRQTANGKDALTKDEVGGVAVLGVIGSGVACRKQADKTQCQQHHGQQQQGLVNMAAPLDALSRLHRNGAALGHGDGIRRFFLACHIGGDGKQLLSAGGQTNRRDSVAKREQAMGFCRFSEEKTADLVILLQFVSKPVCKKPYASRDTAHRMAVTAEATMTIFHSLQPHISRW